MIISHRYKCVFVHIPKNGGTFVTNFMKSIDPSCEDIYHCLTGHQSLDIIIDSVHYRAIKDYTFFAVLRNPIDKILSSFNYYWHEGFSFSNYLRELNSCNDQCLHLTNLNFITTKDEFNSNIKLIDFENLSNELVSFFAYSSVTKEDLLSIVSNIDFKKVNKSKKSIVKHLKPKHKQIISQHQFLNKEIDFWKNFRNFKLNNFLFPTPKDILAKSIDMT
jgi:hypothetical protein